LFTSKTNIKRAVISTLPVTFQNVVGDPLMFGYTTYFFQLAGVDDPFPRNIVKQIVLAFYTVDKGRAKHSCYLRRRVNGGHLFDR
jgi:hypothetical protein